MLLIFMKNLVLLIILTFILSCCSSPPVTIKVMTWNIWHGGLHGHKDQNFEKDSINVVNTLKVIQQTNPDILLMQETYCCGMDIAKDAGFNYSWRASSNLSIHSKYPILDTIDVFKAFNSHGVKIRVHDKNIVFFNIWLHYLPDYFNTSKTLSSAELVEGEKPTRYVEIKAILQELTPFIENSDHVPVIIGGDFNSGSHFDWIESTKHLHHDKIVEWPVSKKMNESGFKDSFREMYPDPLQNPAGTWGGFLFENMISDRIDYIYYKGKGLQAIRSQIIKDDPSGGFFNSDHRAVLTEFKLN